jgi:hypothetical protein
MQTFPSKIFKEKIGLLEIFTITTEMIKVSFVTKL